MSFEKLSDLFLTFLTVFFDAGADGFFKALSNGDSSWPRSAANVSR